MGGAHARSLPPTQDRVAPGSWRGGPGDLYEPKRTRRLSRRDLLRTGLAAGAMLSTESALAARQSWAQPHAPPKRAGALRVWGSHPPPFDPHLIIGGKTHNTLSFAYSRLLRHKVGAGVTPGSFIIEPDLAERGDGG